MHADITERRQALINLEARENELTEQIQRFKDLVEGIPYGLSMFDADQSLIVCNRPYVNIYGLEEINPGPGTTYNQIVDSIYGRGIIPIRRVPRAKYLQAQREIVLRVQSHSSVQRRTFDPDSRFPRRGGGWVAIHEDVTTRVRVERALEASRTELGCRNRAVQGCAEQYGPGPVDV